MKYYIEVCDLESPCEYIMQSRFFDTEKQALKWARSISYLSSRYSASLMTAGWDDENETHGDIGFVRYVR